MDDIGLARLKDDMDKHCEDNGLCKKVLGMGFELVDEETRRTLERKGRAFMIRDTKVKKARLDLEREICNFMESELSEGEVGSENPDGGKGSDDGEGLDESEGMDDAEGDM